MIKNVVEKYNEWQVGEVFYVHERGNYGFRIYLKYPDGSKRIRQRSGFKTKKLADEERRIVISRLVEGKYVVDNRTKFGPFLMEWLENDVLERVGSNATYETYRGIVNNHIVPELGNKKIAQIDTEDIRRLYRKTSCYSFSCARLVKTVMNVALKYAVVKGYLSNSPAEGISLPRKKEDSPYHTRNVDSKTTLNLEQIEKLIEVSRGSRIYIQVLFNLLMGLRRSEIIGVKYSDVDFQKHTLTLRRQLGKKKRSKKEEMAPKTYTKQEIGLKTTSSYRTIPIPDIVYEAILEQRKQYEQNRSRRQNGKCVFQDLDYICCSSYGRPRSRDYHWIHYKRLLKQAGLPDIRWHDLRSTYCTLLLKEGFSPKAVSVLMGHSKELITVDVYGDNRNIMDDDIPELTAYMEEVVPKVDTKTGEIMEGIMDISDYIN